MRLDVKISPNNSQEKIYILKTVFEWFFGNEIFISLTGERSGYAIECNKKRLIFKDFFFSNSEDPLGYLSKKNIPENLVLFDFERFNELPCIFGYPEITENKDEIICSVDVFAIIYFMLTRWEEHVVVDRDIHGRFPAEKSLAVKKSFIDRPIVNEYLFLIKTLFSRLGIEIEAKKHEFTFIPTHDVDNPRYLPETLVSIAKRNVANIVKLRDSRKTARDLKLSLKKTIFGTDIYDNFGYLCDQSEKSGLISEFYFMASNKTKYDIGYDIESPYLVKIIKEISQRGHKIGFHPGYFTVENHELWQEQMTKLHRLLEKLSIDSAYIGRQHYLRFEVPATWRIWESCGYKIDSTMGYADREGFRSGTCYEYPVFDFLGRRQMNLVERPLIVMEGTFMKYQRSNDFSEIYQKISSLIAEVRKYGGVFTILTHNTTVSDYNWAGWRDCYESILAAQ